MERESAHVFFSCTWSGVRRAAGSHLRHFSKRSRNPASGHLSTALRLVAPADQKDNCTCAEGNGFIGGRSSQVGHSFIEYSQPNA
eukprot:1159706-Pelagomonas_calceolata.AAC.5